MGIKKLECFQTLASIISRIWKPGYIRYRDLLEEEKVLSDKDGVFTLFNQVLKKL